MNRTSQQSGSVEALLVLIIIALVGFLIYQFNAQAQHDKAWNAWARECEAQGGFTSRTRVNWSDCIIDGKPTILKGYEHYQADKSR